MKISIVTPAYNEAKNLDRYFEAIARIEYPREHFEVVIVNDGSSDGTLDMINGWIAKLPQIAMRVVTLTQNRGRAVAREEGAKAARYDSLFFLDVKCEVHDDTLKALSDIDYPVVNCHIVHSTDTWFERFFWLVRRKIYRHAANDTYITKENFDHMAKGGTFFCQKEIFLRSQIANKEDTRNSDDTKLLWNIVQTTPILNTDRVKVTYHQRVTFVENMLHLFQRGPKFVDYYYAPGRRYFFLLNAVLCLTLTILTVLILRPEWLLQCFAVVVLSDFLVACYLSARVRDIGLTMLMFPLCGVAFFIGVFRGLIKKRVVMMLVMVLLVGVMVAYLYINRTIFTQLYQLQPIYLLPIFFGFILQLYLNGLVFKILMEPFSIHLREYFLLSAACSFVNLISPFSAGSGMRALYMRKKYHLSYSVFFSVLLGNYVIGFLVNSLCALGLFYFVYALTGLVNWPVTLFFLAMLCGSLGLMVVPNLHRFLPIFSVGYLGRLIEGWTIIRRFPSVIFKIAAVGILLLLVSAGINMLTFRGIGIEIDPLRALYMAVVNTLLVFINITPSGIGVSEGLFVLSGQLIHVSPGVSLIVALIQRAVNTLVLVSFGSFASYRLSINSKHVNDIIAYPPAETLGDQSHGVVENLK